MRVHRSAHPLIRLYFGEGIDGGHRISVLIAWIKNDWGDRIPISDYKDKTLARDSQKAAEEVRKLLRQKGIGEFDEYLVAENRYAEIEDKGGLHELEMDVENLGFANKVRRWQAVEMGFPIQWVKGSYEKAEESFIKINKTGRRLSDWETKLVENRSSSFARTVMSIAQIHDAEHCWPGLRDPDISGDPTVKVKLTSILKQTRILHDLLFTPVYETPISDVRQPLLATPYIKPELKPAYLAEVLTITEGHKGQKPETQTLIRKDKNAPPVTIISNGLKLLEHAYDVISNIYGPSPRSLTLMPLVYFYNKQGVYVRSLLYGMLYWLNRGKEKEIFDRKRLFTIHRRAFEETLLEYKENIISRIGRRIGSGAEVTYPTARYYQGLLELLIKHSDNILSNKFKADHVDLVETLGKETTSKSDDEPVSKSRTYRGQLRSSIMVRDFIDMFVKCPICGGRYYPGLFTQVDHIEEYAEDGPTSLSNARNTHPFCNNNRPSLERIQRGEEVIMLPAFENPSNLPKVEQLTFLINIDDTMIDDDVIDDVENTNEDTVEEDVDNDDEDDDEEE